MHEKEGSLNPTAYTTITNGSSLNFYRIACLSRHDSRETAEAVLQIAWAVTNLAAAEHEIVKAVLVSAPALIAHLSGWLGSPVAEQCAWALGKRYRYAL